MGPPTELSMGLKVSNLFLANSTEWYLEKIREIFPFDEEKILKIKASKVGTSDKLCWHGTKSGESTTKSGYHAAFAASNDAENLQLEGNWNKEVWNLQTAPKVKMLIWKFFRGALPVGKRLDTFMKIPTVSNVENPNILFICSFNVSLQKLCGKQHHFQKKLITVE